VEVLLLDSAGGEVRRLLRRWKGRGRGGLVGRGGVRVLRGGGGIESRVVEDREGRGGEEVV